MRVAVLTNGQGNQVALVNKIADVAEVVGVVLSDNIPRRKPALGKRAKVLANRIAGRTVGRKFAVTWNELLAKYDSLYPSLPTADVTRVRNVNDPETLSMLKRLEPDVVVVSGTNIVGRGLIETAAKRGGILNLHTGISPYVRGGPNCTNWCLAINRFDLIGNTVMWLDAGIDTGNIIATEQTPLTGDESILDLHWAVMEHAHDLYVRTLRRIATGGDLLSIAQSSIADGLHFQNSDWGGLQMWKARRNFERSYREYFRERRERGSGDPNIRLYPM